MKKGKNKSEQQFTKGLWVASVYVLGMPEGKEWLQWASPRRFPSEVLARETAEKWAQRASAWGFAPDAIKKVVYFEGV